MRILMGGRWVGMLVCTIAAVQLAACSDTHNSAPTSPTSLGQPITNGLACASGGTIQLSVAQATRVDCSNGGNTVTLAGVSTGPRARQLAFERMLRARARAKLRSGSWRGKAWMRATAS
jgi:hypothetical protein